MGKESLADIVEGNVTGPVYFSLLSEQKEGKSSNYNLKDLKTKKKSKNDAMRIK